VTIHFCIFASNILLTVLVYFSPGMETSKAAIICLGFLVISFSALNSSWTTHSRTVLVTSNHSYEDVYAEFMNSLPESYTEVSEFQNYSSDGREFTLSHPVSSPEASEMQKATSGIAQNDSESDFKFSPISETAQQIPKPVKHALASSKDVGSNETTLSRFLGQMSRYIPHLNEIKIGSWAEIRRNLGYHFGYGIAVLFFGFCTWVYVRYVRPKMQSQESLHLDENNVIASLFLLPAEEILFYEDQSQSDSWYDHLYNQSKTYSERNKCCFPRWGGLCSGCGTRSRTFKFAVTNKRLIAQRQESTFFGTCMVW
jgi:hypothetical protein